MRFAYADPPYLGQAKRHYDDEEVDHAGLISWLDQSCDGWALSCSSPSLAEILPLCPEGVRIAAWVKPFAIFKPNVNPGYTWEPVIFKGGRKFTREQSTVRDWVSANITLKKGLVGVKPPEFNEWVLSLFNLEAGDVVWDVFPGTGGLEDAVPEGVTYAPLSRDDMGLDR